jgi:hypothetical protein
VIARLKRDVCRTVPGQIARRQQSFDLGVMAASEVVIPLAYDICFLRYDTTDVRIRSWESSLCDLDGPLHQANI